MDRAMCQAPEWIRLHHCPRRGLPRSSATILIDLVCLFVCLCVCTCFTRDLSRGICTGFSAYIRRLFYEGPKPDPSFRRLSPGWTVQRGPTFSDVFSRFIHSKCACSDGLLNEIEIVIPPQCVDFSARKPPFQGGRLPRGSKLVRITTKFTEFWEFSGE